jgi:hypothetical protein
MQGGGGHPGGQGGGQEKNNKKVEVQQGGEAQGVADQNTHLINLITD